MKSGDSEGKIKSKILTTFLDCIRSDLPFSFFLLYVDKYQTKKKLPHVYTPPFLRYVSGMSSHGLVETKLN